MPKVEDEEEEPLSAGEIAQRIFKLSYLGLIGMCVFVLGLQPRFDASGSRTDRGAENDHLWAV